MRIHIKNPEVSTREINSQKGSFKLHSIEAWVDLGGIYPEKVSLNVKEGSRFQEGEYSVHPSSFRVGQYGRLEFDTLVLAKA
jgi:hypothetical protein